MKVLVFNVGSSSVKYEVFDNEKRMIKGIIEGLKKKDDFRKVMLKVSGIISRKGISIDAVGHRVVHGGRIERPQRINSALMKELEKVSDLAPLHNPSEIEGIRICRRIFDKPQIAVFDTAFHQSMPEKAYTYAIPSDVSGRHRIRRYGFHGTSHKYVAHEACRRLRKDIRKQRIVTCHLGNGCSVTAIRNGKSIDTSMGMTPLEGLVMGTRSGDIDPGIMQFLTAKGHSPKRIHNMLNKESGLLGISGLSSDMRKLLESKSRKAKLAVDVFCYRAAKYIGAYAAAMNGIDMLVFTGGIGENSAAIRNRIRKYLGHLRIKNVLTVRTDEARMIAREVRELLGA
ncbi:MAG: acetate/propionate family kinase [Candidatus Woesearchaeota archaeon]